MARQTRRTIPHLLNGYLEQVSWKLLAEYPVIIRELIRGKPGVYALYKRDRLYYVGLAKDLRSRLKSHLKDRHNGAWDRFSVYLTDGDAHVRELEALLLRIVAPSGNRMKGRLARAAGLYAEVNRLITEHDADRRAALLGGHVAERRRRSKVRGRHGQAALAGISPRRIQLKGTYKGEAYRASLRTDGQIYYDGQLYSSPQASTAAAVGRRLNGWRFWHYKNGKSKWVPLQSLRRKKRAA